MAMMKKRALILLVILLTGKIQAQVLGSDASGNSTILYQGKTVGIDVLKTAINLSVNNYKGELAKDSAKWLVWGINSQAKADENIANIFDGGSLGSDFKLEGFVGRSFNYGFSRRYKNLNTEYDSVQKLYDATKNLLYLSGKSSSEELDSLVQKEINAFAKRIKISDTDIKPLSDTIPVILHRSIDDLVFIKITSYANTLKDKEQRFFVRALAIKLSRSNDRNALAEADLRDKSEKLRVSMTNLRGYWAKRLTLYAMAGLNTSAFKYFSTLDSSNFSNSFEDKFFTGGHAYVGANYNLGAQCLFGLNGGVNYDNNLISLKSKEYTLKTSNSNSTQTLTSEKKITAYSGDYNVIYTYPVNADIIIFFNITDSAKMALNGYLRQSFSDHKKIVPNTTNFGLAVYFFKRSKSKFLGGMYVEAPDVRNNIAKMDAEAHLRQLNNRLTFGLIAKFTFSSLFSIE
jgi:hypothetical protein